MNVNTKDIVYAISVVNKNKEFKGYISKNYYGKYILNMAKENNIEFITESAATNFIYHNYSFLKDIVCDEDKIYIIPIKRKDEIKVVFI